MESVKNGEKGDYLEVKSVQAIASQNLKEIPRCYLRRESELDEPPVDDSQSIPVIDMNKLLDQTNPLIRMAEMENLHLACKHWGFFRLINFGLPKEVIENIKGDMMEFFELPLETKATYSLGRTHPEGYGWQPVVSEEERIDWNDSLVLYCYPLSIRNMALWPNHPTSFRESLEKYLKGLQEVVFKLLKPMSMNLGLDSETLGGIFKDGSQAMRATFYPQCAMSDKVIGLSPHSDPNALTMLLQVNDVQGLQIKKDDIWVIPNSIPDSLNVFIGDTLQMMSNGEYKSVEHRVLANREKDRLSIASFNSPPVDTMVGPLPDLVKVNKPNYKSITYGEYKKVIFQKKKIDGKSAINNMKL